MLCALCVGQASALEYTMEAPDDYLFGRPTSDDTIYEWEDPNVDRSKNTALIPPGFGTPTSYLPGSGDPLTPNLTGDLLSGVTIQIKHLESGQTRSGQTTTGGSITFDQLEPGAWEVRELAGIEGWKAVTDTVQTVNVVSGEESTATIINEELPGLRIIKYDRKTMELMPDVAFEIFRDNVSLGIFRTNEQGEILLVNQPEGSYRIEERNPGDDEHIIDTTPQYAELTTGMGIVERVFYNDQLPGIHLIKVDSADLSKPIANVKFRIEAVDGSWGPEEYTTSEDGTIDLSKLPVGAYVVTELECPGYVIDEAQRIIHLDGNETAQFVFTNSKLPSLRLTKISSDGSALAGVTYSLTRIEDGSRYMDQTTSSTGTIIWEGLQPGVYSLKETDTVSDHILDEKEYHVELFPGKDSTIVLENDKRPNLIIWKRDADSGAPVEGAVFLVKGADGHSVAEVTTGPDGSAKVPNLLPMVYEVIEKSVPSPYLLDADPQLVTLYKRCTWARNGVKRIVWRCVSRLEFGKKYCHNSPSMAEDKLHTAILTVLNRVVEASDGLQDELAETLRMVCTPEGVGNNLLELEHELEALTAQQNALLDQALANMEDLTIAEQLKTLLEEKQNLQTRIDAAKKEAANRINEDSRMAEYATYLEEHLNGFPHYDDEVVRKMIERVTVVDAETIRVKFRYSDLEIEQSVC